TGEGTSVSTLSVEISSSGSSTSMVSPTCLSQRVTVPSVTLSPSSGRVTSVASPEAAGAAAGASGAASAAGASGAAAGSAAGAAGAAAEPDPSPTIASCAPTSIVSSSSAKIASRTPETGDGISVSTLSVETSSSGSSTSTVSPTCFSQRVTVPSVTLSPSAGRTTEVLICESPLEKG